MNNILEIIDSLDAEQQKSFRKYLKANNRRGDAKNIALFDLYSKGVTKDVDQKIYGHSGKNKLYALKKRLYDNLINFVALDGFSKETSQEMEALKLLLAARIFFEKRKVKVANKTLEKAFKTAQDLDAYALLNEICHTKVQYAHLNQKESLATIAQEAKDNYSLYKQEISLNLLSAQIKQALSNPIEAHSIDRLSLLINQSGITIDERLTFKSLYQLMHLANKGAQLHQNYQKVQDFIGKVFEIVTKKPDPTNKHQHYRSLCYYLMALSQFRNKQFANSLATLEQRAGQFNLPLAAHDTLEDSVLTLKAMNTTYLGQSRTASQLLEQSGCASLEAQMSLVMNYILQSEWNKAAQIAKIWQHSDAWYEKKKGWNFMIQKNILEILLLVERNKLDLALSRINSFKRRFKKQLLTKKQERVLIFLELISYVYEHPEKAHTESFKARVEQSFKWIEREQEDLFAMSFYAWLKAKMDRTELYPTLLELVKI